MLYASDRAKNKIFAYSINDTNGALNPLGSYDTGTGPEGLVVHPSRKYLYAICNLSDTVMAFAINGSTGALSQIGSPLATGTKPSEGCVSPDGKWLYVGNCDSSNISCYSINALSGGLTALDTISTGASYQPDKTRHNTKRQVPVYREPYGRSEWR